VLYGWQQPAMRAATAGKHDRVLRSGQLTPYEVPDKECSSRSPRHTFFIKQNSEIRSRVGVKMTATYIQENMQVPGQHDRMRIQKHATHISKARNCATKGMQHA
jgi:hypothetical protein